jgi:hypothetical protein
MKQSRNTISDWLDKYRDPKIDKQVEKELEEIIIKHQREMKTPMQEHIEWLDKLWGNASDIGMNTLDLELAMMHAKSMLEKEKEVMCEFAYNCHRRHKVYGDFMIQDYYNETFNATEK